MSGKKRKQILWITDEPEEIFEWIAANLKKNGYNPCVFNNIADALNALQRIGCRRCNGGFWAVVFDLTVKDHVKLCRILRHRHPRLHRVCFTQFPKDAEKQLPHLTTKRARHTLIREWIQRDDWVEGDWNGGRHAQLTNILKSLDI